MAEDIKLTREQQIEAYEAEHKRRMLNVEEFKRQQLTLKLSLAVMDQEKSQQIEATLDSMPDVSAKGMVQKILQIPMEKRTQLNENIVKMGLAVENETRRAGEANRKRKILQQQIKDEQIDAYCQKVEKEFKGWLTDYRNCLETFDRLAENIQGGYDLAPDFYKRIQDSEINRSIKVSIESHFQRGSTVYMDDIVEKIQNLSDSYGEPLIQKSFQGSWPADSSGTFFSQIT